MKMGCKMDHDLKVSPPSSSTSLWLLVSLMLSLLVLPLLEHLSAGPFLLRLSLTSTFIIGAIAARSRLRTAALVLLLAARPTIWATNFVDLKPLFIAHCVLGSTFFWLVGGVIVYVVISTRTVTVDSVLRAICAYLLFGLAWALSFWSIYTVTPDAFSLAAEQGSPSGTQQAPYADFSQFVYFSFVTMATLGYGDITPVGRITRSLAWIQCVTGQFYVAIVIAWLVSALPRPGQAIAEAPAR